MAEADFAGKTVVITGAGGGLGADMARRFGEAGAAVVIAEIDAESGARTAERLRTRDIDASFHPLDVRQPSQCNEVVDAIVSDRGHIDVWVNNAGIAHKRAAETLPIVQWDESIAVMLSGAFYCCQAAGRVMLKRGHGVIVYVASVNGYWAIEGRVAYSSAKAGLIMLTQSLGIEWAARGVRVVGIAPSVVMTELVQKGLAEGTASVEAYEHRTPMRRLGEKEEISEAVLYLASDEASYVVAETLRVDGGWGAYSYF